MNQNRTTKRWLRAQQRREIEQAINEVKGCGSARLHSNPRQTEVSRFRYHNGRFWNDAKDVGLRSGVRENASNKIITVRGEVPRAFLK